MPPDPQGQRGSAGGGIACAARAARGVLGAASMIGGGQTLTPSRPRPGEGEAGAGGAGVDGARSCALASTRPALPPARLGDAIGGEPLRARMTGQVGEGVAAGLATDLEPGRAQPADS